MNLHRKHSLIILILLLQLFIIVVLVGVLIDDSKEVGVFNLESIVHAELVSPVLEHCGVAYGHPLGGLQGDHPRSPLYLEQDMVPTCLVMCILKLDGHICAHGMCVGRGSNLLIRHRERDLWPMESI